MILSVQGKHYETVILDMGNSVGQIFQLLAVCKTVYVPIQDDLIARCKLRAVQKADKAVGKNRTGEDKKRLDCLPVG